VGPDRLTSRDSRSGGIGLSARTAAAAAAVFVPFFLGVGYFSISYFQRQYEQGIGGQQTLLASRVAAGIDQRFANMRETLLQVSRSVSPAYFAEPGAAQRFLDERITLRVVFDEGMRLVANDGRLVAEYPFVPGRRGADLSGDDVWQAVSRTGAPAFSRPYATASRRGSVAVRVAVPVRDGNDAVMGQLQGAVRVDGPNVAGDLAKVTIGREGYFVIVTGDRLRVLHPDPSRLLREVEPGGNLAVDRAIDERFEGAIVTRNTTGLEVVAGVARLRTVDWALFANMPMEELRAPFVAARPAYAWAVAGGVVLLAIAVWLSLRRATRPLVEMTAAVERIAAHPVPGQRIGGAGAGEVARLAGSFDRLLEALDAREAGQRQAEEQRRALEARLEQQQRLDSLGVLAGGIAHDFNNLLTPIIANASLAMTDLPPGHALRGDMQEVVDAARRGAELARRILTFSRRQVITTQVVDLNAELRALEKTLRAAAGDGVDLRVETIEAPAPVRVDPTQLQQAIVALAANAREAMPAGGRLTLAVSVPGLDGRTPWEARKVPEGRYAVITVADTGAGIDAEVLPRIFEPFFTTKGRGRAMGLGLPTVLGILQQHGGDVEVTSAPGAGTTFRLYLPLGLPAEKPSAVEAAAPQGARLRILLVEDEPTVRALAGRILRRAGHEVLAAASPAEALAHAGSRAPDLLLTDVLLPEMDGIELHRRLAERWPGLPVLFMSGFPGGNARLEEAIARGDHFLQKPFGPGELLDKVREASAAAGLT
jgi:signal transduction histidine kinase/ActR/RegA family two-component response regulator